MALQWWACICVCSCQSVVYQVCAEDCERNLMWRNRLCSATSSPKAQLPRRGRRKLDRKPQRKPHERLRKEQQLCGNGNDKVTAAAANLQGSWLISRKTTVAAGQRHKQAWLSARNTTRRAPSPVVIKWCRASHTWLCVNTLNLGFVKVLIQRVFCFVFLNK